MPFFRFHFVEESRLASVSRQMAERIREVVGCPREHIVFELIHSSAIHDGIIKTEGNWPFVEVEYFERPREIQHEVARILYECLNAAGYSDSDVYFRYLHSRNYYENGKCMEE